MLCSLVLSNNVSCITHVDIISSYVGKQIINVNSHLIQRRIYNCGCDNCSPLFSVVDDTSDAMVIKMTIVPTMTYKRFCRFLFQFALYEKKRKRSKSSRIKCIITSVAMMD